MAVERPGTRSPPNNHDTESAENRTKADSVLTREDLLE